jgi:hypothetical protein
MHKRKNSSHREKNAAATDKENHLLQKNQLLAPPIFNQMFFGMEHLSYTE